MQPGSSRLAATTTANASRAAARSAGSYSIHPATTTARSSPPSTAGSDGSLIEHLLHGLVEVRDLALVVVEDVASVGGGLLGRADLPVDLDVLGHHVLQPVPVRGDAREVVLVALGVVLQLPGLEAGAVDGEGNRPEELDVGRVVVEHRGREDRVVADRQALVVAGLLEPGQHALVRDDHHAVGTPVEER